MPLSLAIMIKARRTLLSKIRLIGSRDGLPETPYESETAKNIFAARDLSTFSSPEDMARRMVARAIKKTVVQHRQLVITNVIVLAAFIPRCIFVVFVATSNFNNERNENCNFCGTCQPIGRVLMQYLFVRPDFFSSVAWISSALPSVVCLWGMLSGSDRRACTVPSVRAFKLLMYDEF